MGVKCIGSHWCVESADTAYQGSGKNIHFTMFKNPVRAPLKLEEIKCIGHTIYADDMML